MRKLFALLLLPSIAFAGKIGENYVGAKLGSTNAGISVAGVDVEWDGFSFKLNGNYNTYNKDSYGIDLNLDFVSGSGLDGPLNTSGDVTKFEALLRPHMTLSEIKIFANLGVSVADLELKVSPNTYSVDESSFSPGLGFELSFNELTFTPSVDWVDYDTTAEGVFINLPISYEYNDKVSITFEYEVASFDDVTISGTKYEYIFDSLMIGLDYKF
jgi:opacity protein-like surface antigen